PGAIRAEAPWPAGSSKAELDTGHEAAPRQDVTYTCPGEHERVIVLSAEATPPDTWDCNQCGKTAYRAGAPGDAPAPEFRAYNAGTGMNHARGKTNGDVSPEAQLAKRQKERARNGGKPVDPEELFAWALARRDGTAS